MRPQQWQCYCCQQFWSGLVSLQDTCVLQHAWLVLDSSRNLSSTWCICQVFWSFSGVQRVSSLICDQLFCRSHLDCAKCNFYTYVYIFLKVCFVAPGLWNGTLKCSMTREHVLTQNISFPFLFGLEHFHFRLTHESLLLIDWCVVCGVVHVKVTAAQVSQYWVHI